MAADVIVLGAGIIGVSTALQLARRGKSVALVDRREPGMETSYGNAGLIQREGVVPYSFPQQFAQILRYARNNRIDAHFHWSAMPSVSSFLAKYWWHSNVPRHELIARAYAPLIEHSIATHDELIREAGAEDLIAKNGWQEVFRSQAKLDETVREADRLKREYDLSFKVLTPAELAVAEPNLSDDFIGALKWEDPWAVKDPLALTRAYVALFEKLGGRVLTGDAKSLSKTATGWRIIAGEGVVEAKDVVVALGPWSDTVTKPLGYNFLVGVKRGYHMHYAPKGNAKLNGWTMDAERGYFLAPMNQGIRLTTGAEFARRDAPKTPVQLARAEAVAREIFPLGERLDKEPWMGARPCTPDMMPVIGKAPRHDGLWFAFGHAHHGLTLGPVTGQVIAEAMMGEKTRIDISAYRPERFNV
ncbi:MULTISPECIES: FAD-binding oxidoreductase [Rhizobium/Agrobacterium group]|jgi:D-amino-acid dehydrogenase|uniref:D-amino-acid dehydrogenase n=1 Tax=Rhizobium soli TaxID=424798 RepID=A0A7X0JHG7_9HYPH|nr:MULTISPECIES: FAD-binding oxidoreductase [Rhizobium/Agrobacterium group]RYE69809.1 MAG: FAD-binding oxidoreductase [Rhizobiaceae bacterium]KQQ38138.1 amino acid dehydrogenase [Rhizobium sp. Leaf306]KQQ73758.1 amino acid dehydrogenase [Rhizobium sp. Leaf321]MBB6507666.1 D-amino-acid dehydrogenase [Rhizobium soli]MBD8652746.1 FAD-binding oxidoreductase [Rhizobium sp. CFBP 13726]